MSQSNEFDTFVDLVLRNLSKNGFPTNAVSFSQDKLYESAARQGFSFNKVRERLREKGVESELKGDKVVFSQAPTEDAWDMAAMASKAQEILSQMDPAERDRLLDFAKSMQPDERQKMRDMFDGLGSEEKQKLWEQFQKR